MKMTFRALLRFTALLTGIAVPLAARAADTEAVVPQNGTIGYLVSHFYWAMYTTPDTKAECPQGLVPWGPREQYKVLFPDDGTKRTAQETHLKREIDAWFPNTEPDKFPFYEAVGPISWGLNLDGKVGPNDFVSPDGEKGVDNELFRVLGCVLNLRPPDGPTAFFANQAVGEERWNRVLFELTGVDNLNNDDDVTVTIYQGKDHILTDATGNTIMPGGSQRVDMKWGDKFVQSMKGKIVDGVLTTEPIKTGVIPWSSFQLPTVQKFHDMRLKFKVQPDRAQGLIAGYVDIENWYLQTVKSESTHHQSYGQSSPSSIYKVLRRRADAYPDPVTGANTAISAALEARMVQVFLVHPDKKDKIIATSPAPKQVGALSDK